MVTKLTERQEKILDVVVREYVNSAQPVSSSELLKRHNFGVSPATIRTEMQKLTDKGYLSQPHTSAGRVPTDKGYRFFVNELLKKEGPSFAKASEGKQKKSLEMTEWKKNESDEVFKFIQNLTRQLAHDSRALALNYFKDEDIFWKEGWEELLQEPEFGERINILNFTELLKDFESHIEDQKKTPGVNVYIGKENRSPKAKDFTVISSHYKLSGGGEGVISILGPKRMEYDRNINLINNLMQLLDNI